MDIINKAEITEKRNKAIFNARAKIYKSNKKCLICGKENPTFCDSHSIPENIFDGMKLKGGLLYSFFEIMDMDLITNISKGKKNTGIFKNICRDCDNIFFRDLDRLDIMKETWDLKELKLQEVRILLYQVFRKREHSLMIKEYLRHPLLDEKSKEELNFNVRETKKDIESYKRKINGILKNKQTEYLVIYENVLDYETNFCCVTSMQIHLSLKLWEIIPSTIEKTEFFSYEKQGEFYTTVKLSQKDKTDNLVYLVVLPKNGKTKVLLYSPANSISGNIIDMELKEILSKEHKLFPISWFACAFGNNLVGNERFLENFKKFKNIVDYIKLQKINKKSFSLNLEDIEKEYILMEKQNFNLFEKNEDH